MKLAILGDLHIRSSNPENRIDNYKESLFEKLRYVFSEATYDETTKVPVLLPGDVFDNPIQSNLMLAECINLLRRKTCFVIAGQHDLKFRVEGNTALDVLIAAKSANKTPLTKIAASTFLYSCSYNEEIPEIETEGFNILLIHKMIVEEKHWEGQTKFEWANAFLRRNKFDLVVSGDNHKSFFVEYKNRHLINCGSLMRSSKDQINHKPCYVIYDTDRRKYEIIYIPVKPASEVFDMQKLEVEKERDEKLAALVDGLTEGEEIGLSFQDNLHTVLKENKVSEEVVTIINEAMKER